MQTVLVIPIGQTGERKIWDQNMQSGGEAKSTKQREIGSRYMEMKLWGERMSVGGRWQKGSIQIAQDLTGIFLED